LNPSVRFHKEGLKFYLSNSTFIPGWIYKTIKQENKQPGEINFIFCSDEYLLKINREHLKHDYYTDIITFDYSEKGSISGDIYISVDRIRDNAKTYHVTLKNEVQRVIIHGVLHLLGYLDKTPSQKKLMTHKEDFYLSLRAF